MTHNYLAKPYPSEIPKGWRIATREDEILPNRTLVYALDGPRFVPWDGVMRGQFALVRDPSVLDEDAWSPLPDAAQTEDPAPESTVRGDLPLPTTELEAKKRLADIWNSEEPSGFVEIESNLFGRICDLLRVFDEDEPA